ncbi:MAG: glycosyltransferase family 39 protein [Aureispira sp.]|nr:glycosyltransferase family 39 protein [Aureispira sp.]
MNPPSWKSKENRLFIVFLILLHLIYFGVAFFYQNIYNADSPEFLQQAINLRAEGSLYAYYIDHPYEMRYETLRPPLYAVFIMFIQFFSQSHFSILLLQNILSILGFWYLYKLLLSFNLARKPLQAIIGLSLVLYPSQLIVSNSIWSDTLFQLVFFVGFVALIKFLRHYKLRDWILYNSLLVVGIFIKPVLLFFWVPNLLFSIFIYVKIKKPIIIPFTLMLPIAISLWNYRNYTKTGYSHFSSIQSFNLLKYNAYRLLIKQKGVEAADDFVNEVSQQAAKLPSFADQQQYIADTSISILKANLIEYGLIHARGSINYFLDPGRENLVQFFPVPPSKPIGFFNEWQVNSFSGILNYIQNLNPWIFITMLIVFLWNFLVLCSGLIFLFNKKIDLSIRIAIFLIVAYFSAVSGVVGNARYKMSIYLLLIFTLPFTIDMLKVWWINRRLLTSKNINH